jgi:hypothetical protein
VPLTKVVDKNNETSGSNSWAWNLLFQKLNLPSMALWNASRCVVKAEYRTRYFQPRATVTVIAAVVDVVSLARTIWGTVLELALSLDEVGVCTCLTQPKRRDIDRLSTNAAGSICRSR